MIFTNDIFSNLCFRLSYTGTGISCPALWKLWCSTWCLPRSIIPIGHTSSPFCWALGSSSSRTSYWARSAHSANISKTWMERAARWVRVHRARNGQPNGAKISSRRRLLRVVCGSPTAFRSRVHYRFIEAPSVSLRPFIHVPPFSLHWRSPHDTKLSAAWAPRK